MSYAVDTVPRIPFPAHGLRIQNAIMAKPPPDGGFIAALVRKFRVVCTNDSVLDHLKWKPTGNHDSEGKIEASDEATGNVVCHIRWWHFPLLFFIIIIIILLSLFILSMI